MESGLKKLLIIIAIIILGTSIFSIVRFYRSKEKYKNQIEKLEIALEAWGAEYESFLPTKKGDSIIVPLRTLKQSGYIEERFVNPKTKMQFSNQLLTKIVKKEKGYQYEVLDHYDTIKDYDETNKIAPMIILNGNETEYAELNEDYEDAGYKAITIDGKNPDEVKIEIRSNGRALFSIDTSKLNTYQIIYHVFYAKEESTITRTVIVRDQKKPTIEMDRLTIKAKEAKNYDLMKGVKIEDNSKTALKTEIEGSLAAIPGRYILVYRVSDQSGNTREKKRIVRVE